MSEVLATGVYACPLEALRASIAGSSTWQSIVEADETDAINLVHFYQVPMDLDSEGQLLYPPPLCVVNWQDWRRSRTGPGSRETSGSLAMQVQLQAPGYDIGTQAKWFANQVGGIVDDIIDLSQAGGGYLNVTEVSQASTPRLMVLDTENPRDPQQRPFWEMDLLVEFFG